MTALARGLVLLLLLAGCRSCSPPGPPSLYDIERLSDPYEQAPARGAVTDRERAAAVLDRACGKLGYGQAPSRFVRTRAEAGRAWAGRQELFLAHGGFEQLRAAYFDLIENFVSTQTISTELRHRLRQSEARVEDFQADQPAQSRLRKVYLAELCWCLHLLAEAFPDQPR